MLRLMRRVRWFDLFLSVVFALVVVGGLAALASLAGCRGERAAQGAPGAPSPLAAPTPFPAVYTLTPVSTSVEGGSYSFAFTLRELTGREGAAGEVSFAEVLFEAEGGREILRTGIATGYRRVEAGGSVEIAGSFDLAERPSGVTVTAHVVTAGGSVAVPGWARFPGR